MPSPVLRRCPFFGEPLGCQDPWWCLDDPVENPPVFMWDQVRLAGLKILGVGDGFELLHRSALVHEVLITIVVTVNRFGRQPDSTL